MKVSTIGLALGSLVLAACGGGNDSVAGIDARGGQERVAIVSSGTISGFGSIIVNGVRYDTTNASFSIDGTSGSQSELAVGDVVVVTGSILADGTSARADAVEFDDIVEGPVSAVDAVAGTIEVLGQTVVTNADTSFDDNISPASINGVNVGMIIEVSGFRLADGTVVATRVEAKPAGGEFEVTGTISNLSGTSFSIEALTVDFSAAQLDDFPAGAPENGQRVEAKGMTLGAGGELIATRLEFKGNDLGADDGNQVEIEGFITRFASSQDFDVSGFPVSTNGSTIFEGGTANDLGLNIKVEVEGTVDASGVLLADKVDIRRSNQVRLTALVDSVDAGNNELLMLGVTIAVDPATRLEDKSDTDLRPFSLSDLNAGDYVEVRGDVDPSSSNRVEASLLEKEDADPESIIQGFVESVANPSYELLGVTITTNGSTIFRDANDNVISSTAFFNQLDVNDLVKAEGLETSATAITATEVEFENEF